MSHRQPASLIVAAVAGVLLLAPAAPPVHVDMSACPGMYDVLKAMRNGVPQERVSGMLDDLLESPPYQVMFRHYNRPWRPDHLPKDVFKRMILSLQFEWICSSGENERADAMRARWTKFYPDLSPYESRLRRLEPADLPGLIREGVRYAQGRLTPGWEIPGFSFMVIPNG